LPLNIGPQMTSSQPPRCGGIRITGAILRRGPVGATVLGERGNEAAKRLAATLPDGASWTVLELNGAVELTGEYAPFGDVFSEIADALARAALDRLTGRADLAADIARAPIRPSERCYTLPRAAA
jgi:hypothetical protein